MDFGKEAHSCLYAKKVENITGYLDDIHRPSRPRIVKMNSSSAFSK